MAKNIKHLSTLTALTLAVSPAYGEETQNTPPSSHTSSSASQSVQKPVSTVSSGAVRVRAKDIDVEGPDLVVIRSPRLAHEVTFRPQVALDLLSEVSPINLADVTLDENGRVVIRDEEFVAKLRNEFGDATSHWNHEEVQENNGVCGVGC